MHQETTKLTSQQEQEALEKDKPPSSHPRHFSLYQAAKNSDSWGEILFTARYLANNGAVLKQFPWIISKSIYFLFEPLLEILFGPIKRISEVLA